MLDTITHGVKDIMLLLNSDCQNLDGYFLDCFQNILFQF